MSLHLPKKKKKKQVSHIELFDLTDVAHALGQCVRCIYLQEGWAGPGLDET